MPNSNGGKEDKRPANSIRKRQPSSGSHNGAHAKTNGDPKGHDSMASNMIDKVEIEANGEENVDDFTRKLLKRKGNRSNGESDVEWEKVVYCCLNSKFYPRISSFADRYL